MAIAIEIAWTAVGVVLAIALVFSRLRVKNEFTSLVVSLGLFTLSLICLYLGTKEFFILSFSVTFGSLFALRGLLLKRQETIITLLLSLLFFSFLPLFMKNDAVYVLLITYLSFCVIIVLLAKLNIHNFEYVKEWSKKDSRHTVFLVVAITVFSITIASLLFFVPSETEYKLLQIITEPETYPSISDIIIVITFMFFSGVIAFVLVTNRLREYLEGRTNYGGQ